MTPDAIAVLGAALVLADVGFVVMRRRSGTPSKSIEILRGLNRLPFVVGLVGLVAGLGMLATLLMGTHVGDLSRSSLALQGLGSLVVGIGLLALYYLARR